MYSILPFIKSAGISCPISALRYDDDFGIGDMKGAYRFIDYLEKTGFSVWKLLPIHDVLEGEGGNPFQLMSAFALNPLYIDVMNIPDIDMTSVDMAILDEGRGLSGETSVDFKQVQSFKNKVFAIAFDHFYENDYTKGTQRSKDFTSFVQNSPWVNDYALYQTIHQETTTFPTQWEKGLQTRDPQVLHAYSSNHIKDILLVEYIQWLIYSQWRELRSYAHTKGVYLMSEMPFYLPSTSTDVWIHPAYFSVDKDFRQVEYVGLESIDLNLVLYNWKEMEKTNYAWVIDRFKNDADLFDGIVINHFNNFIKYAKINPGEKQGKKQDGPGIKLLNLIIKEVQDKKLTTLFSQEDVSSDPSVSQMGKELGFETYSVFIPHYAQVIKESREKVLLETTNYTTAPLKLWWKYAPVSDKLTILQYLKQEDSQDNVAMLDDTIRWEIITKLLERPFTMKIIQIQDILGTEETVHDIISTQNKWNYRLGMSIEQISSDERLIAKLNSYMNTYGLNNYFKGFNLQVLPEIFDEVIRYYNVGEDIHIWAFSEQEMAIKGITNLPLASDETDDLKELPFVEVSKNNLGILYRLTVRASKTGSFLFSIKSGDNAIRSFENKLELIIQEEKLKTNRSLFSLFH